MKATWRLGRFGGVEVGLHWTVLVIVALLTWSLGAAVLPDRAPGHSVAEYWVAGFAVALAFGGSILAHELSHAIVARHEQVAVDEIVLWMFGGMAKLRAQSRTARGELLIALAGPATSVAVGCASLALAAAFHQAHLSQLVVESLAWLGAINLALAAFNLLPGAPLDGGRVLAAVLWWRWHDEGRARRGAAAAGRVLGQVLVGLGIVQFALLGLAGVWTAMIGWLIMSMARMEMAESSLRDALAGVPVSDVMTSNVVSVPDDLSIEEFLHGPWAAARVSTFPVTSRDGRPGGLITLQHLGGRPPDTWPLVRLRDIATPLDRLVVAAPDELLLDALARQPDPRSRILVVRGGVLVGLVSPSDVSRAVERGLLARAGNG